MDPAPSIHPPHIPLVALFFPFPRAHHTQIKLQTGEIGRQANGAVTVTDGETVRMERRGEREREKREETSRTSCPPTLSHPSLFCTPHHTHTQKTQLVYATACAGEPTSGGDGSSGVPLSVTYAERFSAAGRTAGSFIKRDGRPRDHETLTSRLIDRPLRPAFPRGWAADTQVLAWVLSYDGSHTPEPVAITAAGAALAVSDIPLVRAVAGARVSLLGAEVVFEAGDPPGVPAPGGGWLVVNPTTAQMEAR